MAANRPKGTPRRSTHTAFLLALMLLPWDGVHGQGIKTQTDSPEPKRLQANLQFDPKPLIQAARRWKAGDVIPDGLRHYFDPPCDVCAGTGDVLEAVENTSLLTALVLEPGVDDAMSEGSLARLLDLVGPTRAFDLFRTVWPRSSSSRASWLCTLANRMTRRHVVVDGMFISLNDMTPEDTRSVLDRVERDLRAGKQWKVVYRAYSEEYGYRSGNRTKIGNLGSFVVFDDPALAKPHRWVNRGHAIVFEGSHVPMHLWRLEWLPLSHLKPILQGHLGDILRLWDADNNQWCLYQVREVYGGAADRGCAENRTPS